MDETVAETSEHHPEWKVFSLTYVEYPAGDPIGKVMALLSLAPLAIVVASVSVFAVKRDLHTMAYGAGMIGNGIVSVYRFIASSICPHLGSGTPLVGMICGEGV